MYTIFFSANMHRCLSARMRVRWVKGRGGGGGPFYHFQYYMLSSLVFSRVSSKNPMVPSRGNISHVSFATNVSRNKDWNCEKIELKMNNLWKV